jgi:hypothetical protein
MINKIDLLLNIPLQLPSTSDNFTANIIITFTSPVLPTASSLIQPIFQITLIGTNTNSIEVINNVTFDATQRILTVNINNLDGSIIQTAHVNIVVSYISI